MNTQIADYTHPDLSNIVNGQPNDATDVTNIFTSSNQVNDILDVLSNNVTTIRTGAATLTQNQDVNNFCNANGGAFTLTLPAGSGSVKAYYFSKFDGTYNKVTIQTAGADKIDNPFAPIPVPTTTSIELVIPGDSCCIFWDGTYWRVINYYSTNKVTFAATTDTAQTINGGSDTKIYFEDEDYDYGGYYNAGTTGTTSRFTPLIKGIYLVSTNLRTSGAGTVQVNANIYFNGAAVNTVSTPQDSSTSVSSSAVKTIEFNGTTDYVEAYYRTPSTNKAIGASGTVNNFEANLLYRT